MEVTGEENRLSSLKGLPQAKRRRGSNSDQVQNDNSATSSLTDAPSRILDPYDSSFLPSELELFSWTVNCPDLLESEIDDCVSEALPNVKKRTPPSVPQQSQESAKSLLENQAVVKSSFHRQNLADRIQNSIENLQMFYEKLSNMVGLGVHGYGDSEGLPQTKKQRETSQLPNDHDAKFGDSVTNLQVCNRDRQFGLAKLDVVSSENHTSKVGMIAHCKSSDETPWHWMSQITQESLTETLSAESPVSRTEGGESKYTEEKISASTDDLKDLLSSLQSLLSVLKNHETAEQIARVRMQALRERKEALRLDKEQYKEHQRQRAAPCVS